MRHTRRDILKLLGLTPIAVIGSACLGGSDSEITVLADGTPVTGTPTAGPTTPTTTVLPFTPTPPPSNLDPNDLTGLLLPVEGACLPTSDRLMPNAPRAYRNGVHEGVDFYFGDACVVIGRGTPVVAVAPGVILRADHDYVDITPQQVLELDALTAQQGFSDPVTLDIYRGRQIWVDHGNGIVTRYCHLEEIRDDIAVGIVVQPGQVLGGIGESGTPESVTAPNTELHLHFEIRIGESFLGADLPPDEVRALYVRAFANASAG
jgi:murein DD-endopeptidase MepM/ murein hydrolase activator NlpD